MSRSSLSAETVRQLARHSGVDLTPERAAELLAGLEPILEGDARIAELGLGALRPLGTTWDEEPRE